jgi:hypothetical protein
MTQLKAPQNKIPPMPPTISNVASEKRELGLQRKVQMRKISPFRELGRLESLILLSANA